jgi:hypothetical protein
MNTRITKVLLTVAAAAVTLAHAAPARAQDEVALNVPFDFIAGGTRLPPGHYVIRETSNDDSVLVVERAGSGQAMFLMTNASTSVAGNTVRPDVTFEKIGADHFLSRIDMHDGVARELALTPSVIERERTNAGERAGF